MPRRLVLVVEDDEYLRRSIVEHLQDSGLESIEASSQGEAIRVLSSRHAEVAVALLDVRLPTRRGAGSADAAKGRLGGLKLGRAIRERYPRVRIVGMSFFAEDETQRWFLEHGDGFLPKSWLMRGAHREFVQVIERAARKSRRRRRPATFVVHGHDERALREVLRFIEKDLGWPRPKVLRELPSHGRTVIEKFEDTAQSVDIVLALLTPDDTAASVRSPNEVRRRARQNVIFELGYFFAKLQRTGGRVIVLHKGGLELPSDIAGLVYIDISRGVGTAAEELRAELGSWL